MPVYNGEAFIADAIDSLLAQTMADFRLLISDNCSTDNTRKICLHLAEKDSRIRYFCHPINRGSEANFRFLLDCASSPFFMWAAADDLWSADYLLLAINHLVKTDHGFCFPTFTVCSLNNNSKKSFPMSLFSFVESTDRKERVLTFIQLHHLSHKCNLVYSCFKTDLIKAAYDLQDISNDGALATVILGMASGQVLDGYRFTKRYLHEYPRRKSRLKRLLLALSGNEKYSNEAFNEAKNLGECVLIAHFPEYQAEIKQIFRNYRKDYCDKNYQICTMER